MLNYNYQLQLNENRKLAFGAGNGYSRTAFFKEVYEQSNSFDFSKHDVNLSYTLQHKKIVKN
jgi:hypothetical protein